MSNPELETVLERDPSTDKDPFAVPELDIPELVNKSLEDGAGFGDVCTFIREHPDQLDAVLATLETTCQFQHKSLEDVHRELLRTAMGLN